MTRVSGWCSAPEGARPMCAGCRPLDCEHECHLMPNRPLIKGSGRHDTVNWGQTEDGPGTVGAVLIRGLADPMRGPTDD